MLQLADWIIADWKTARWNGDSKPGEISQDIRGAQRFVIDNCHDYLSATGRLDIATDFPRCKLPFAKCWFEFTAHQPVSTQWGVLARIIKRSDECVNSVEFRVFFSIPNMTPCIVDSYAVAELDDEDCFTKRVVYHRVSQTSAIWTLNEPINATLLAIGLCHCKNVKQIDQVADISALGKKWIKRNGNPKFTYKVLQIGDMKHRSSSSSDSPSGEPCTPKALHIVRGHFATYTAEKPLFGHIVGTVWKPAHARGDIKAGAVVKDYSFKPEFVAEHADQLASNNPIGVQV